MTALKRWGSGLVKIALLLAGLGATYGLSAILSLQMALNTREVEVPNLRGLTPEEAELILSESELSVEIDRVRRIHDTVGAGRITEQAPEEGITTRRQRTVRIWLSSGRTPGSVPNLIGASESAARRSLEENSFMVDDLSEIRSALYPIDAVVAHHQAREGSDQRVSLLVNRGERGRTYVMPDLIGIDGEMAADILRTRGFRITVVADHPYPGLPSGIVLRQSPEAGFQIAPGEPISIEVSR